MKKLSPLMRISQWLAACSILLLSISFQSFAQEPYPVDGYYLFDRYHPLAWYYQIVGSNQNVEQNTATAANEVHFLGDLKDFPDPVIDENQPLKIPNQDDIEALFKYLKKYTDSISLGSPDSQYLKEKIFMNQDGRVDLNQLLQAFRYLPIFDDVSFSLDPLTYTGGKGVPGIAPVRYGNLFHNLIIKSAKFKDVKLDNVDFSGSHLSKVSIANSSLNNTICLGCKFFDVTIDDSNARDADFSFSSGSLEFNNSNLIFLKISDSDFDRLKFINGSLKNSVFINSGDIETEGTDTFNNVEDSSTSKSLPLRSVGLVYKDSFPGGTANQVLTHIRDSNLQPVKIEYNLQDIFIDGEKIQQEVETIMDKLAPSTSEKISIPQQFLKVYRDDPQSYPEIAKLEAMASSYINKLDALIIPGGLDLEPYVYDSSITANGFYHDQRARLLGKEDIEAEKFPIRTVLEFLLINLAQQQNIPLFLLCRGAQIYNIYKGGGIIPNLTDKFPYLDLDIHLKYVTKASNLSPKDATQKIMQIFDQTKRNDAVTVYGNHHQAIDRHKLGDDVRILLIWNLAKDDYVPYALYDQSYPSGAWLTQFHPEVKQEDGGAMSRQLSDFNMQIFNSFFDQIHQRPRKEYLKNATGRPSLPVNPIIPPNQNLPEEKGK